MFGLVYLYRSNYTMKGHLQMLFIHCITTVGCVMHQVGDEDALLALGGVIGCIPPSLMPCIASATLRDCAVRAWIWSQTCLLSAL